MHTALVVVSVPVHDARQERTGTLKLRGPTPIRLTFCQGLVMSAHHGELSGRDALREIFNVPSAIYGFTRELRPVDDPLNVSIKSYLETELSEMTKKVVLRRDDGERPTKRSPPPI